MKNINTATHWDTVWSEELEKGEDRPYPDLYPSVIEQVPDNSSVVDIGCGTGYLLSQIRELKNCTVYGLDLSPQAIQVMGERRKIEGVASSVPPIPFKDGEYNVAICTEVMEHITDDALLASELMRIVKPGGRVIVTVPNNRWGPEENPEHQRTYTAESLQNLFVKHSNKITVVPVSNYLMLTAER